jgi:hypothetical protein
MNNQEPSHPECQPVGVSWIALFGLCRDCKHWNPTPRTLEYLAEYPRDQRPDEGWMDAVCKRIQYGTTISASGGWDGATVDSVETDANFGCVYFEPNEQMSNNAHMHQQTKS